MHELGDTYVIAIITGVLHLLIHAVVECIHVLA